MLYINSKLLPSSNDNKVCMNVLVYSIYIGIGVRHTPAAPIKLLVQFASSGPVTPICCSCASDYNNIILSDYPSLYICYTIYIYIYIIYICIGIRRGINDEHTREMFVHVCVCVCVCMCVVFLRLLPPSLHP